MNEVHLNAGKRKEDRPLKAIREETVDQRADKNGGWPA